MAPPPAQAVTAPPAASRVHDPLPHDRAINLLPRDAMSRGRFRNMYLVLDNRCPTGMTFYFQAKDSSRTPIGRSWMRYDLRPSIINEVLIFNGEATNFRGSRSLLPPGAANLSFIVARTSDTSKSIPFYLSQINPNRARAVFNGGSKDIFELGNYVISPLC